MRGAEPIFLPGAAHAEISVAGEAALCDRRGALFFPCHGLLCVSDLHLEKGSSFARRGMLVPPYDTAATLLRLQAVIDHYRPHRPLEVVSLDDDDPPELAAAPTAQPERAAEARQQAARLLALVDALPAAQREAFLLHEEGGLSLEEIAVVTGSDREAVKSRLRYAMDKLRRGMGDLL